MTDGLERLECILHPRIHATETLLTGLELHFHVTDGLGFGSVQNV
jgi:hypothetical protein